MLIIFAVQHHKNWS